ncbi:hypothetical protein ACN6LD_003998, partial [Streptomyces sp. SAS_272]|nr:hypothetical protein [Streptomyces sp. AK04-3B]
AAAQNAASRSGSAQSMVSWSFGSVIIGQHYRPPAEAGVALGLAGEGCARTAPEPIRHDQGHAYLTVNHHPFVLPPKLARLIDDQLQHSPRHSNTAGGRYLLPGHSPGRPRNPLGLADTLRHHGLPARAARNTAMMDALVDLPPMVIADLLGIHPKTAERWAALAGGNWSEYLAARRAAPQGQAVEQDTVPS